MIYWFKCKGNITWMHADVCFYTLQGKCQSGSSIGFQYNDITCHNYVIVEH